MKLECPILALKYGFLLRNHRMGLLKTFSGFRFWAEANASKFKCEVEKVEKMWFPGVPAKNQFARILSVFRASSRCERVKDPFKSQRSESNRNAKNPDCAFTSIQSSRGRAQKQSASTHTPPWRAISSIRTILAIFCGERLFENRRSQKSAPR